MSSKGKVVAVCISEKKGTQKTEVPSVRLVPDHGIEGDAHAGNWHRQVSLLSAEKIDDFRARGADVDNGAVISDNAPMTYAYYHANVKPKPQAAAASEDTGERWICNICGYIYEGHLPEDFVCPLCKHGAEDFSQIDKDGNVINDKKDGPVKASDDGEEKWVCNVCGYIYEGHIPDDYVCPICGVGKDEFSRM